MAPDLLKLWALDHRENAQKIQELELAGSNQLADLLVVLSSDLSRGGNQPSLSERRVDQLLARGTNPGELLEEIDALNAAAQRWRSALKQFRKAVEAQVAADAVVKTTLCEADDDYWYL